MGLYLRARLLVGAHRTTLRSVTVLLALAVATSAMAGWGPFEAVQDDDRLTEMAAGSTLPRAPADGTRTTDTPDDGTPPTAPAGASHSTKTKTKTDKDTKTDTPTDTSSAVGGPAPSAPDPVEPPTEPESEALVLPGPGCVNGWSTPSPESVARQEPLDAIRTTMGISNRFYVSEMRYFTVPEAASPGQTLVKHWYVKASLDDDPSFRARWIVTKRDTGEPLVAAVAPYGTSGFQSPDWRAFEQVDGEEPTQHAVPGVPGTWSGSEYDFVTGPNGSGSGLPDAIKGCLDGT
jgi:hypothetical protein